MYDDLINELRNTHPRDSGYAETANKAADAILALHTVPGEAGREAAIEECAKLIESGAGMADLIDQDELDEQAKLIRALARTPSVTGAGAMLVPIEPTPDMRIAGGIAWSKATANAETYVDNADACYKAMLAAVQGQEPDKNEPDMATLRKREADLARAKAISWEDVPVDRPVAAPTEVAPVASGGVPGAVYTEQPIFDAIAAATHIEDGVIVISARKFVEVFNSHRDLGLWMSMARSTDAFVENSDFSAMFPPAQPSTNPAKE
jgi:hypothetical protein